MQNYNLPTFSGVGGLSIASNPWEPMKWEITHGKIIELVPMYPIETGENCDKWNEISLMPGEKCIFDLKYMYNVESFDV